MTETTNRERVGTIFEAFGRGDVPFILDQLADDATFTAHLDAVVPWAGEYAGRQRITEYFMAMGGAVEVLDHPVRQIIADGDTVVATGGVSFRIRETGTPGETKWVYVFGFADGKVRSFDQYNDTGLADAFR